MTEQTQTEKLREKIKLYATGACIYQDGSYPCPVNFETNDEVCLDCLLRWMGKEARLKFVPPKWELKQGAHWAHTIYAIDSQIKEIEL